MCLSIGLYSLVQLLTVSLMIFSAGNFPFVDELVWGHISNDFLKRFIENEKKKNLPTRGPLPPNSFVNIRLITRFDFDEL